MNLPNPPLGPASYAALSTAIPGIILGAIMVLTGNSTEGIPLLASGSGVLAAWIIGRSQQAKGIYENYINPAIDSFQDSYAAASGMPPVGEFDDPGEDQGNISAGQPKV